MHKSLYSLMLMDSVVSEIDRLALQQNTNRSNLVNQILAEYVSLMTPEKRINNIFHQIESMMNDSMAGIVPFVTPNQLTMSLKSSLEYKYRPTIKYEVELFRAPEGAIGRLSVIFRSQSAALVAGLDRFFQLWCSLEQHYLSPNIQRGLLDQPGYSLDEGRFTRTLAAPRDRDYSNEQLGRAISNYIAMFDELLKGYLSGRFDGRQVESHYLDYLNQGVGLL